MNSKVHPKYKTQYRVGNWQAYERALVQRGDITRWFSANAIDAWRPGLSGLPGGPRKYSDVSIETALTLRLIFHWPLRQTEGFLRSILAVMQADLEAPDHTTLSRRGQQLKIALNHVSVKEPVHLVVDSTGLSGFGQIAQWKKRALTALPEAFATRRRAGDADHEAVQAALYEEIGRLEGRAGLVEAKTRAGRPLIAVQRSTGIIRN